MLRPQPKTSELVNNLIDCINNYTKPSLFEIKRIEREAKRLPSAHDTNITLGYLYVAARDYEKAKVHFKNALTSTLANDYTISDLAMAYTHAGQMNKARDVLVDALNQYPNSIIINRNLHFVSIRGLDIENYLSTLDALTKMKTRTFNETDSQVFEHLILWHCKHDGMIDKIKNVGDEVFHMVEKYHLTIDSQAMLQLPETDHVSCIYKVICKDAEIETFDLNWDFSERVVDNELLDVPVVVNFQVVQSPSKAQIVTS